MRLGSSNTAARHLPFLMFALLLNFRTSRSFLLPSSSIPLNLLSFSSSLASRQFTSLRNGSVRVAGCAKLSTSFVTVATSEGMRRLGEDVANAALESPSGPLTIFMRGDVGAGKTTFSRGFVKEYTGEQDVQVVSPTYLIDVTYEGREGGGGSVSFGSVGLFLLCLLLRFVLN